MINLSTFYNLSIYNTEGKYIGKISEVVLNIKKGRISYFKTKAIKTDKRSVGLKDAIKTSFNIIPEEEQTQQIRSEDIIDIPYDLVTAVGDIIIIDQEKLNQLQKVQQQQPPKQPQKNVQKVSNVPPRK